MKKLLLSATALISLTAGAMAADLPSRRAAPPPAIAAVPLFTWTGFYVGVNAGAGFNTNDDNDTLFIPAGTNGFVADTTLAFNNNDDAGFVGGGQIGYNFQFGSFVLGAEADIQFADLGGGNNTFVVTSGALPAGFVVASRSNGVDWFGTVRARAGVAFDRILIYATGGFAYGESDDNGFNNDDINTGWTVGGGVEWALPVGTFGGLFGTSAVTFGVEGLFVSLDSNRSDVIGFTAAGTPVTVVGVGDSDNEFAVVRAKLNFKF